MAFYNEKGERIIAIFQDGVLVSDDPEYINFTGNVEVTNDGMGGVVVNVLGSSGGGVNFETPVGTIDGANRTFTVSNTPLYIVLNGATYFENDGYTLSGLTITIISALTPQTGSTLRSAHA